MLTSIDLQTSSHALVQVRRRCAPNLWFAFYSTHNEPPANKDKNTLLLQFNGVLLIAVSHNRNWCKFTQVVCPGGQAKGGSLLSGFW